MNNAKHKAYIFGLCRLYQARKALGKSLQTENIQSVYHKVKEELANHVTAGFALQADECSQAKVSKGHELWNLDGEDLAVLCSYAFHTHHANNPLNTEGLVSLTEDIHQFLDSFKFKTRVDMAFDEVEKHIKKEIDKFIKVAKYVSKHHSVQ